MNAAGHAMEKRKAAENSVKPPNSPGRNIPPHHWQKNRKRSQQVSNDSAASPQGAGVDVRRNAQQDGRGVRYPGMPSPDVQGRANRYAGDRVVYATSMAPNFVHGGGMKGKLLHGPMSFMPGPGPSRVQPAVGNRGAFGGPTPLAESRRAPQRPGRSHASVLKEDTKQSKNSQKKAEAEVKGHAEVKGQLAPRRAKNDEANSDPMLEVTKSMEGMQLGSFHKPKQDTGVDPCAEETTLFETMALQMEPLTKDRGVLKRVVHPGWGQLVTPGSGVAFHYEAFLENSSKPFYSTRKGKWPCRCVVEEAKIMGLSFAVATMRKGEKASVLVSPPYGSDQTKRHPAESAFAGKTVLYEVELLQIIDPQDRLKLHTFVNDGFLKRMPFRDVLKLCDVSRQRAASFYKCNQFFKALGCYTAAIQALEEAQTDDAVENAEGNNVLLGLYNNAAVCAIKTGKGKLAVMYSERALQRNPWDANALYRCGVGLKMQGKFDKATQCLFKALNLRPNSVAIPEELWVIESLKRLQLASSACNETAFCPRPDRKFQTSDKQLAHTIGHDNLPFERQTVSFRMRSHIREQLECLRVAKPGTSLPFTVGFNDIHIAFIRTTCWMMGLRCKLLQEGIIVYAPSAEESNQLWC